MYNNHDDKIKAKEEFKFRNFIAIRSIYQTSRYLSAFFVFSRNYDQQMTNMLK